MDIKQEKLKMWQEKLAKLEQDFKDTMIRRGEAIAMGDLRENAAFQMLDEDKDTLRVRIDEVKKIIEKIEQEIEAEASK
jgi:hypothetical protein